MSHAQLVTLGQQHQPEISQWLLLIQMHGHGTKAHALTYAPTSTAMEPLTFFIMVTARLLQKFHLVLAGTKTNNQESVAVAPER